MALLERDLDELELKLKQEQLNGKFSHPEPLGHLV